MRTSKTAPKAALSNAADFLVPAIAASLPWSTSLTGILIGCWLVCLLPTLSFEEFKKVLASPLGALPTLLFLLAAVGMLWSPASPHEKLDGLSGFVKLLTIPYLVLQYSRGGSGRNVLFAFLVSCVALLVASFAVKFWPALPNKGPGIPAKSYIVQSIEFVICVAILADFALAYLKRRAWFKAATIVALSLLFVLNLLFVIGSRTALFVLPGLAIAYALTRWRLKGTVALCAGIVLLGACVWFASPLVRQEVTGVWNEVQAFQTENLVTSSGLRLAYWAKSLEFLAADPILGHGTGSIRSLFLQASMGQSGAEAELSNNPHNQTLAVGIQLGAAGIAILWAMWAVQIAFFGGRKDAVGWVGLVVVLQNVLGSLFNSFIFDFTEGWIFVLGVGVTAGVMSRTSAIIRPPSASAENQPAAGVDGSLR